MPDDVKQAIKDAAIKAAEDKMAEAEKKSAFNYDAPPPPGSADVARINTPYHADFIRELKSEIPYIARRWDNDKKVWIITGGPYIEKANELVAKYFPQGAEVARTVEKTIADQYEILHLRRSAPFGLIVAAYEYLAGIAKTPLEKQSVALAFQEIEKSFEQREEEAAKKKEESEKEKANVTA